MIVSMKPPYDITAQILKLISSMLIVMIVKINLNTPANAADK